MNEYADLILNEQRSYYLERPPYWKKEEFAQWSYSYWAMGEMYELAMEQSSCPIVIRFEEFIKRINDFACINSVFSPAYDMAMWLFDLCLDIYMEE